MKGAVLHGPREIKIEEVEEPKIKDGEVLIETHVVGICGTDVHIYQGHWPVSYPLILGHECCGHIVQERGKTTKLKKGQRVVIQPNFSCGECSLCRMNRENLCFNKIRLGVDVAGCFAEYVKAPERYIWPIPDSIPDEWGSMIEPLAVAIRAVRRIDSLLGRRVMVLGGGPIGLFVLQVAKQGGATVFLADLIEERIELAAELGADKVIHVNHHDLCEYIRSQTSGEGVDVVVEAAGATRTIEQAIEMVKPGGKIILVGLPSGIMGLPPASIVRKEIEISGSLIYSYEDFHQAVQIVAEGRVKLSPLISHVFSLEDIDQAFNTLEKRQGIKVLIRVKEVE